MQQLDRIPQLHMRVLNGEKSAKETLYHQYSVMLFTLIMRYVRSKPDAEDLLHETFIKIFTNIDQYQGLGSFEGWLKKIAVNNTLNYLKSIRKLYDETELIDDKHINLVASKITASESLEYENLMEIIELLPSQKKIIFKLYEIEGYRHAEIAELLGITEAGCRSQLVKARNLLADLHKKINRYEQT